MDRIRQLALALDDGLLTPEEFRDQLVIVLLSDTNPISRADILKLAALLL